MRFIVFVFGGTPGGVVTVAFKVREEAAELPLELRLLVEQAIASARHSTRGADDASSQEQETSPLPFAEDGVAVEPRPVSGASAGDGRTGAPRRSLRREREARELIALAQRAHQLRHHQRVARQASQHRLTLALAAALRRKGMLG